MILENLIRTMLSHGCKLEELNVPRIVEGQHHRFTEADFAAEWAKQLTALSLTPAKEITDE